METQFRAIDKVGIELEGAWKTTRRGINMTHDGSVCDFSGSVMDNCRLGEVVSDPFVYWSDLVAFMQEKYPDHINRTCGLHVHISTPTVGAYEALMNERYFKFLMKSLAYWGRKNKIIENHSFWRRISGSEYYCRGFFRPEEQVIQTGKASCRYTQVNYCYGLHRTMEVRVLPMFKQKNLAISAIYHILRMTQRYLTLPNAFSNDIQPIEINADSDSLVLDLVSKA